MPSGREIIRDAQQSMPSMSAAEVFDALQKGETPVILDVREKEEWDEGHIAQATHLSRGRLEGRVEELVPDKDAAIICH